MSKLVCITGASRGIGYETALEFAAQGYDLILLCKTHFSKLQELELKIRSDYGRQCYLIQADISDHLSLQNKFFSYIEEKKLFPDILIHNAGISYVGLLQDMSFEAWHEIIDTNLSSAFYLSKFFIPHFLRRNSGKIVFVSSVWGNWGASCEAAYSASKGGLNSFTKALAKELAPSNIQVNAVAFGAIDTTMNNHLTSAEKDILCEEIPAGRMGTPKEAGSFLYQLAHCPVYLTGQIITMDGGWM